MDLTAPLISALASLIAAGLAATVSLLITVLSKEQKTSEFRQQWIDGLRVDIAEFIAQSDINFAVARLLLEQNRGATQEVLNRLLLEFMDKHHSDMVLQTAVYGRIRLRLNERDHAELLAALDALDNLTIDQTTPDSLFGRREQKLVLAAAAIVLKEEWKRVKKGEPAFIWIKRIAASVVAFTLAALVALTYRAL